MLWVDNFVNVFSILALIYVQSQYNITIIESVITPKIKTAPIMTR